MEIALQRGAAVEVTDEPPVDHADKLAVFHHRRAGVTRHRAQLRQLHGVCVSDGRAGRLVAGHTLLGDLLPRLRRRAEIIDGHTVIGAGDLRVGTEFHDGEIQGIVTHRHGAAGAYLRRVHGHDVVTHVAAVAGGQAHLAAGGIVTRGGHGADHVVTDEDRGARPVQGLTLRLDDAGLHRRLRGVEVGIRHAVEHVLRVRLARHELGKAVVAPAVVRVGVHRAELRLGGLPREELHRALWVLLCVVPEPLRLRKRVRLRRGGDGLTGRGLTGVRVISLWVCGGWVVGLVGTGRRCARLVATVLRTRCRLRRLARVRVLLVQVERLSVQVGRRIAGRERLRNLRTGRLGGLFCYGTGDVLAALARRQCRVEGGRCGIVRPHGPWNHVLDRTIHRVGHRRIHLGRLDPPLRQIGADAIDKPSGIHDRTRHFLGSCGGREPERSPRKT